MNLLILLPLLSQAIFGQSSSVSLPSVTASEVSRSPTPLSTPGLINCTTITADACGTDLIGYPVLRSAFPTSESFTNFLQGLISDSKNLTWAFLSNMECSHTSDHDIDLTRRVRYYTSFWCAKLTNDALAIGCPSPSNQPRLCSSLCRETEKSIQLLMSNQNYCPAVAPDSSAAAMRNTALSTLAETCSRLPSSQCSNGTLDERSYCGFLSLKAAQIYCEYSSLQAKDACCALIPPSTPSDSPNRPRAAQAAALSRPLPINPEDIPIAASLCAIGFILLCSLFYVGLSTWYVATTRTRSLKRSTTRLVDMPRQSMEFSSKRP